MNSRTELKRIRYLCERATYEQVERVYAPPARTAPRLTASENEEIARLYEDGMRPANIAREVGVSEWTIHHRLNRMGVERRPTSLSPAQVIEATRLYELGESIR